MAAERWHDKPIIALTVAALTLVATVFGWGVTWQSHRGSLDDAHAKATALAARLAAIEQQGTGPAQRLGWEVGQHTQQIGELRADVRSQGQSVAELKAQLAVITSKLDAILETLKRHEAGDAAGKPKP